MRTLLPIGRMVLSQNPAKNFASSMTRTYADQKKKILMVLYSAGQHAKDEPKLLGCIENELGFRKWIESQGYQLITTASKDGPSNDLDKHIEDAEIVITTPFHPGYITKERIAKAKNLKLCVTAGIGSDHVDLNAANERKITVCEVTGSNVVSVAEHVVMTILTLVRNFVPSHEQVMNGEWEVAAVAKDCYDVENKVVATVGVGRIGYRVLQRLKPFDLKEMLYYDYQPLTPAQEKELGNVRRCTDLKEMLSQADIVTINCPLHESTKGLFNRELISHMKDGAWLINTARGAICDENAVAEAVQSGKLRGYGGDVWYPQPAPYNHVWRTMRNKYGAGNAMTPHMSGTSLDAQKRYADGVKSILQSYFSGKLDYRPEDVIVTNGEYATRAYGERIRAKDQHF